MNEMAAWPPPHDPGDVEPFTTSFHLSTADLYADPLFDRPDTDRAYRESLDVGHAVKFGLAFSLPFLVLGVVMLVVIL